MFPAWLEKWKRSNFLFYRENSRIRMIPPPSRPYRQQRDLFETNGRLSRVQCPVCQGKKTVPFWSRQGKTPVIGGKQIRCETCHGTGQVPALD